MKDVISYLYLLSLLLSVVAAIIYRKYLAGRGLTILMPFLFLTFIQEVILDFNVRYSFFKSTAIIYNIYRPITAIVFYYIYSHVPFMSSMKKLMTVLMMAYLSLVLTSYCFFNSIEINSGYLTIARGLLVTFFAVLFLLNYFNLDNRKDEKYWQPLIWITAGVAIFYSVVTTSIAFQDYLAAQEATLFGFKLYHLIPKLISIFMYSCFSYAFYLCHKIRSI